jgi:hypothetical protein
VAARLGNQATFAECHGDKGAHGVLLYRGAVQKVLGKEGALPIVTVALGKVSVTVTVTWRHDGDFSLVRTKWHSAKYLSSARQKVLGKKAKADVQFIETVLATSPSVFQLCRVIQALDKAVVPGSARDRI